MKISLEQTAVLLKKYQKFVLTAHVNPDGDAVGSVMALALALQALHKDVVCLIDDEIPNNFKFLQEIEMISQPDVKTDKPAKLETDLLVILDSSDRQRIGAVGEICSAPVLNIDHHISNEGFADYCYLDSKAAATGEIIFDLLRLMECEVNMPIAEALYMAIATDCGFFRFSNTTPQTMNICAELLMKGVIPNKISEQMEQKPLASVKALGKAIDTVEFYADGKIACMLLNNEFLSNCDSTDGFIDVVRTIEGLDLAILIKEVDLGICRVSMRAKTIDVSKIAVMFGGGGHKKAAGCTINETPVNVRQAIVAQAVRQLEA